MPGRNLPQARGCTKPAGGCNTRVPHRIPQSARSVKYGSRTKSGNGPLQMACSRASAQHCRGIGMPELPIVSAPQHLATLDDPGADRGRLSEKRHPCKDGPVRTNNLSSPQGTVRQTAPAPVSVRGGGRQGWRGSVPRSRPESRRSPLQPQWYTKAEWAGTSTDEVFWRDSSALARARPSPAAQRNSPAPWYKAGPGYTARQSECTKSLCPERSLYSASYSN